MLTTTAKLIYEAISAADTNRKDMRKTIFD